MMEVIFRIQGKAVGSSLTSDGIVNEQGKGVVHGGGGQD